MDPATAIGTVAAIAQLLDLGIKVAKRLNEYAQASPGDTPKSLENINTILPLITTSLNRIKSESKVAEYDDETRAILHGVVLGCLRLVRDMDRISERIVLKSGEGMAIKVKKVIQSLHMEDKIQDIERGLQAYVQVLILHQVVNKKDVHIPLTEEKDHFEVKELRAKDAVDRPEEMDQLHTAFYDAAHSLSQQPTFIVLQGGQGYGKTQLALEYCEKAYSLKHYPWVFWLQSSSPDRLRTGLEHVASVLRQSSVGTQEEKIDFVKERLGKSWHPWLLVLDDYQHKAFDADPLMSLLPETGHGAVLVTSRSDDSAELGVAIKLHRYLTPEMDMELRRRAASAIGSMDMSKVVDVFTEGFNANTYTVGPYNDRNGIPLVNLAAELGFGEALRLLLDMGADPKLDKQQASALGNAVFHEQMPAILVCLDHEDSGGYRLDDDAWNHITRYAVSKGNAKILEVLLERRGDRINFNSYWPQEGFGEAAERGHNEVLRLLHSHGKLPKMNWKLIEALEKAVKKNNTEGVDFLLKELSIKPSEDGEVWYNAICWALSNSHFGVKEEERHTLIDQLIKAGADINAYGSSTYGASTKNTPLHFAAINKQVATVQFLLERGADPTRVNSDGTNPLQYAASAANREEGPQVGLADVTISDADARNKYFNSGLLLAARLGWRELALRLLNTADIDALDDKTGRTPLLTAIKHKQTPMARMLARKGADPRIADKKGRIPLLVAAKRGMDSVVKDLVKAKNSPGVDAGDKQEFTALMFAAKKRHEKTVEVLLGLGADRDAMNKYGDTALDLAEEAGDKDIIKLLEA